MLCEEFRIPLPNRVSHPSTIQKIGTALMSHSETFWKNVRTANQRNCSGIKSPKSETNGPIEQLPSSGYVLERRSRVPRVLVGRRLDRISELAWTPIFRVLPAHYARDNWWL